MKLPALVNSNSTPSDVRQLSREHLKTDWKDAKADGAADYSRTSCWPCDSAPPGLTPPTWAGPNRWRNTLYREGDIERHPGPKRAMPLRDWDVLLQDVLPTTAEHCDVAGSEFEKQLRVGEVHGPEKLVTYDLDDIRSASFCALKLPVTSWPPLAARVRTCLSHTTSSLGHGSCGWYGG